MPLDRAAVAFCENKIRQLADLVASAEHPRARGVAIARQLAYDGVSPLYWKPTENGDGPSKLAGTIHTAEAALEVAADFN